MRHLTAFKDHVTNKLGKKRDTKPRSVQTQVHPDRRSGSPTSYLANETSPSQFQPENPPDLWQCAFSQMDHEEQNVLLKHYPALTNRDENDLRVIDAIDDVIDTTKKRYEEYQKEGGIRIRRSSGEDIDLRKVAGRIIDAAFSCKEVISSGVACDPTGHAAGAWAAVSLGLTVSLECALR
ncbi:hypothetical protein N7488_008811 [Penicillium malachiteum]|nr:hypothetical protein N7488_008811 [Penicillium malachiteum]